MNQLLQVAIKEQFPDLEFNIIEENERGESRSTMSISHNGIEYKELSRSEKCFLNVMLSIKLMSLKGNQYPLLIDDTEMFSKTHIDKLTKLLNDSGVEYIITKVANTALTMEYAKFFK